MIKRTLLTLMILFMSPLWGGQKSSTLLGVSIPYQLDVNSDGDTLSRNGYAAQEAWGDISYIAVLYSQHLVKRPEKLLLNDVPAAMIIHFVRDDISAAMIKDLLLESIIVNNKDGITRDLDQAKLQDLMSSLKQPFNAGDTLSFYYSPESGLTVMRNQERLLQWPHAKSFFNMLLRMWIGPYPPSRNFKRAILNFPVGS